MKKRTGMSASITPQTLAQMTPTPYKRPDIFQSEMHGGWQWRPQREFKPMQNPTEKPKQTWADYMSDPDDEQPATGNKPLAPYGKQFQPVPQNGVQVAIGAGAWDFQKRHWSPIMVLPENKEPLDFTWPSDGRPALIHERGAADDYRLYSMAKALLEAGAPSVIALRESRMRGDPRVFFDREVQDVTT